MLLHSYKLHRVSVITLLDSSSNPEKCSVSKQKVLLCALVGGIPTLWKMMEFVSWDDDIPNIWKVIKKVPNHQPVLLIKSATFGHLSLHGHQDCRVRASTFAGCGCLAREDAHAVRPPARGRPWEVEKSTSATAPKMAFLGKCGENHAERCGIRKVNLEIWRFQQA
jgi:hypothetical protein